MILINLKKIINFAITVLTAIVSAFCVSSCQGEGELMMMTSTAEKTMYVLTASLMPRFSGTGIFLV